MPSTSEAYGMLAPIVYRTRVYCSLDTNHQEIPLINYDTALHVAHKAGEVKYVPLEGWHLSWRAAANDTLFLLTLIAWLISLTAIHRWPIWKHITPAQRRRAKHQCPTCAYDLAGLTTPTCPECGSTSNQPHTT